jgi:hypothetical protein
MIRNKKIKILILATSLLILADEGYSQRYLSDLDSSLLYLKDSVKPFLKRFDNLRFSGYIQPQFQVAQSKGARSYNGGDFSEFSQSRFMLRRARIKLDYLLPTEDRYPKALFTFQIDATERGVNVRDMYVRLYETKRHFFSLTAGLFARPFGYEVNLSSAYRETPERGRMSQILLPTERDLGAMVSYESYNRETQPHFFKMDIGFFNGQGLAGTTDFDSYKDLISRLTVKPMRVKNFEFSGGLSLLYGGWRQGSKYIYESAIGPTGDRYFQLDSSVNNIGRKAPRHYYGADIQIVLKNDWGRTEWRAEYWRGIQPGTATTTTNPGTLPTTPIYLRNFDGAFLLFLQNIVNTNHQVMVKYDWYDPNLDVKESDIGKPGTNITVADIKYTTLGIGYAWYFNENMKLVLYYDIVKNELTQLSGNTTDIKDNIFTCRIQYRF